jgi:hypothetical protein
MGVLIVKIGEEFELAAIVDRHGGDATKKAPP